MKKVVHVRNFLLLLLFAPLLFSNSVSAQIINTVAGCDTTFYAGDNGPALFAQFNDPVSVAVDDSLNIYIADQNNNRIRKVYSRNDTVVTIAGDSLQGNGVDTADFIIYGGSFYKAEYAYIYAPSSIVLDAQANLYFADQDNNIIRKIIHANDSMSTITGNYKLGAGFNGDKPMPADSVQLFYPSGLTLDSSGNVYIADFYNNRLRKLTVATGIVTTLAGNTNLGDTVWGYNGDGGLATAAQFNGIYGVAIDHQQNIYLVDQGNNCIRKINTSTGIVTTVAGNGISGYSGDGDSAIHATLSSPNAIILDPFGNLYIADGGNNVIRAVSVSTGLISTFAGNGTAGFSGDGGAATSAQLYNPSGMAFDKNGNLYIADEFNSRIREITNITGIKESKLPSNSVNVFPVPGNGNLHIQLGGSGFTSLIVIDALGRQVYEQSLSSTQFGLNLNINLSAASAGLYYLQAVSQTGMICKPIVIQK